MTDVGIIDMLGRFVVYGIASDYDSLIDLVRYRLHEMQTTNLEIDAVSGLHSGYCSKTTAPIPLKSMGKVSMGPLLQTMGLKLIVVRDDEAFAKIEHRLAKRQRPREDGVKLSAGSSRLLKGRITPKKAYKMLELRNQKLSRAQRKKIARKAGFASGIARRRRARLIKLAECVVQ